MTTGEELATGLSLLAHHEVKCDKTKERVSRESRVVPAHRVFNIVLDIDRPVSLLDEVGLPIRKECRECPREEWLGAIKLVQGSFQNIGKFQLMWKIWRVALTGRSLHDLPNDGSLCVGRENIRYGSFINIVEVLVFQTLVIEVSATNIDGRGVFTLDLIQNIAVLGQPGEIILADHNVLVSRVIGPEEFEPSTDTCLPDGKSLAKLSY
jgi:hypothetical protein